MPTQVPALHPATHAAPPTHAPVASHVCGTLPLHRVEPARHATQIPGPVQYGVAPEHVVFVTHCPAASHICDAVPLHRSADGAHTPVHAPEVHTYGHAVPFAFHWPVASHCSGWVPVHRTAPGEHTPLHAALAHTYAQALPASCHAPSEVHVCGWSMIQDNNPASRAFFWADGVMKSLGTLGGIYSAAFGMNGHDRVVGEIGRAHV